MNENKVENANDKISNINLKIINEKSSDLRNCAFCIETVDNTIVKISNAIIVFTLSTMSVSDNLHSRLEILEMNYHIQIVGCLRILTQHLFI